MRVRIRGDRKQRGVALFYGVFGAFVAASMVAVMLSMGRWTSDLAETNRDRMQAQYVAEGALDFVRKEIQQSVANWGTPVTQGTVDVNGTPVAYSVEPIASDNIQADASGIQTIIDTYEVETRATVDGARYTARRIVSTDSTPIFQFAVFYDQDLEIHPGPDMTLSGRVHSNGDMYLGCGNNSELTIDTNYLRAKGGIYRQRKIDDNSKGTVNVRRWVADPWDISSPREFVTMHSRGQLADYGVTSPSGYDSDFGGWDLNGDGDFYDDDEWLPFVAGALEFWNEPSGYGESGFTVMTGEHGIQEAVAPSNGSIRMFTEVAGGDFVEDNGVYVPAPGGAGTGTHNRGYFHGEAGLAIIVDRDGSWTAYDGDGNVINHPDLDLAIHVDEIYDAREASDEYPMTPVVQIDMQLLDASGFYPDNGLLYASHYGMDEGAGARGVQLHNGSTLADPLTVVSEGSIYIEGDYNSVNRTSAAVIADAVNFLSNDWDGTKAPGDLPAAGETTYNVALITGNYESDTGYYNGGLENLPRFHENWNGVSCNIKGSFVNLWESAYATGQWVIGQDRYKAPIRNWEYDSAFNSIRNLPPFTPMSVSARDVVSW